MAGPTQVQLQAQVAAALPSKVPDGQVAPANARLGAYGDFVVPFQTEEQAAEEGSLFVFTNPTPGTAIQFAAAGESAAAAVATKASILAIFNANPVGGKSIRMRSLKLILNGTAPTGTLNMEFAHKLQASTRNALSNITSITPRPVKPGSTPSQAQIWVPLTSAITHATDAAAGDMTIVGRSHIATGVAVNGDSYTLLYGRDGPGASNPGLTAARATATADLVGDAPAVIIPPQYWYTLQWWWITQAANAASFEFEGKYIEK